MPRDHITALIQRLVREIAAKDPESDHLLRERAAARRLSRRDFLHSSVFATAGLALAATGLGRATANPTAAVEDDAIPGSRIAIIGAGIAGLNACYQLKKHGVHATVYEAAQRVGGRMFTMTGAFGPGVSTDIGGEFVDRSHADIRTLVQELGLSLYHLQEDTLIPKTYYFGGRDRSQEELREALTPFVPRLVHDIHSLPEYPGYQEASKFLHLDQQSITEYLAAIGINGWLFDYLNVTLTREYGMEASQQSAINFLIMFEAPEETPKGHAQKDYELFGPGHEIYKIRGGSQRLTDALYRKVQDQVRIGQKLVGIEGDAQQGYKILLDHNGSITRPQADHIILAIPFSILRKIPFPGLPVGKKQCIDEMGYGNSCKFVMGMNGHPWRKAGRTGYTFTDLPFGCGWDSTQHQPGEHGSFTVFGGGSFGDEMSAGTREELLSRYLPGLSKIYPGSQTAFTGKTIKYCWNQNPFSQAGYSSFKKGQWSTLAGWEPVPVGNIFFAGEHVSRDFQGYMNGAAQTGRIAAENVLKKIHHA